MTSLEIILSVTSVLLLTVTVWSVWNLYKLGITVLNVEDAVENALELVDDRIESMQKILEVPLFSDSPEIKRIHSDMRSCQNALINVANSLTVNLSEQKNEAVEPE